MVKSYSKTANHNMRHPIVKEGVVRYMRTHQKQNEGYLAELEAFVHQENISIIQHEVVAYSRFLMQILQPKNILEVGTATGFPALLMAENAPDAKVTTLDRNPETIAFAKENFARYDTRKQITLVKGDAVDILSTLEGEFDFVPIGSAKSKYIVFLSKVLKHLKAGGVIAFDDVLQGGDVIKSIEEVRRGQWTIYRGLQQLFDTTLDDPNLTVTLLPLSERLLVIHKNTAGISL